MRNEQLQKGLLITASIGLVPIALGYGLMPELTLTPLYGFSVDNINLTHIMRAIMGMYIGQIIIWSLGAFISELRKPALYCLITFMLGLAGGRILSILIDGSPHWLLLIYLALELIIGFTALKLVLKND
jgi:hypothetical protein